MVVGTIYSPAAIIALDAEIAAISGRMAGTMPAALWADAQRHLRTLDPWQQRDYLYALAADWEPLMHARVAWRKVFARWNAQHPQWHDERASYLEQVEGADLAAELGAPDTAAAIYRMLCDDVRTRFFAISEVA